MTNFLLIAICLISGMLISSRLPDDSHKGINAWVLYIALPAVSLKYVPHIQWNTEMLFPVISPLIVWIGAFITILMYSKKSNSDKSNWGTLTLTSGLSNTSFLGFPLVSAYYGEKALSTAIICDQINFILFSTFGLIVAVKASGKGSLKVMNIFYKVIKFPPFIGFICALIIPRFVNISSLNPLLGILADTVAPLALFSIGLQLKFGEWRTEYKKLSIGIFYKLLIAPFLVLITALLFKLSGPVIQVSIFEAAMPSLVTSYVLIDEYRLNTRLANLMIGLGIILAFISTAFWWYVMNLLNI